MALLGANVAGTLPSPFFLTRPMEHHIWNGFGVPKHFLRVLGSCHDVPSSLDLILRLKKSVCSGFFGRDRIGGPFCLLMCFLFPSSAHVQLVLARAVWLIFTRHSVVFSGPTTPRPWEVQKHFSACEHSGTTRARPWNAGCGRCQMGECGRCGVWLSQGFWAIRSCCSASCWTTERQWISHSGSRNAGAYCAPSSVFTIILRSHSHATVQVESFDAPRNVFLTPQD